MERAKRLTTDETEPNVLEPLLTRVDQQELIHIDKNEFKIGRARDNDEIILDVTVSRKHCVFRCEGQDEWTMKNLSSSFTFVNGNSLKSEETRQLSPGDIIQFGCNTTYKYVFSFAERGHCIKKPRLDEKVLDTMLTKQKTFAENQECQRKELKDRLEIKHKEQEELKQQLKELLSQQAAAKDDKENLIKQIVTLESKIKAGNAQEQHLHDMYSQLLKKLEDERLQFELKINEMGDELKMSKQEKEMLEVKMREQMERWREQQADWKKMENKMNEEKTIQAQLLNKNNMLEERVKKAEEALKEQEAKAETSQAIFNANMITEPTVSSTNNCIFVELVEMNQTPGVHLLETIDLTGFSQTIETSTKEGVFEKVSDIMDEQLTCSICSELFVNATTLNCMHTFCHHCINAWCRKRRECPVCRKTVVSMNRSLVLDNFIESMIENLPVEQQNKRKEILQERKVIGMKRHL